MYKVTVITVTYNAEQYIENTMHSVLTQSYNDFEYIVKDGNSSDKTNEIIDKIIHLPSYKNIAVKHIKSSDKGIYDAMNEAVQYASGKWLIFMNAGDTFYDNNVLSNVFATEYDNSIDVLYGHVLLRLRRSRGFIMTYSSDALQNGGSICHQSVFEKRTCLIKYPFNLNLKILADREHFLHLLKKGAKFEKINIIIAKEDRNGVSSINYPQIFKEECLICKKYNIPFPSKNKLLEKIKMIIKRWIPQIEEYVMLKKALKKIK